MAMLGAGFVLAANLARAADAIAPPQFIPPEPGSYRLERIIQAPDGTVLDVDQRRQPLSKFTTGRITLLSLIYTHCSDASGCPLAYQVMHSLKTEVDRQSALRPHVRFVSLSFEPDRDTPQAMRRYGGSHIAGRAGAPWYFLTTASPRELKLLLDGFGQDLSLVLDEKGESTGALSHVLKVFLIDRAGAVREIYSSAHLQPAMVLNDIRTLLLEEGTPVR